MPSFIWNNIYRQVASRMNAITGSLPMLAENAYVTAPHITSAQIDDAAYPYSLIRDACIDAEMILAQMIGQASGHPWRDRLRAPTNLEGVGPGIPSGELMYVTGIAATPLKNVVGIGRIAVAQNLTKVLTERPLEDIMRYNRAVLAGFPSIEALFYRIVDGRIYHTIPSPGVRIEYFIYDRATSEANFAADESPLFPDTVVPCYVAGAVAMLLKEEEYAGQAGYYQGVFQEMCRQIIQGFTITDAAPASIPAKGAETR